MTTVRAALASALRTMSAHDPSHQVPPAAVIWPDPERAWQDMIGRVQEAVPVLVLGEHDPDAARGPAIWIRTVLATDGDGEIPDVVRLPARMALHDRKNPWIVYLPGISREDVQHARGPALALAPLVELQYRSVWWQQSNGQPWTPQAFLRSKDGLGLDVAQDRETRSAVGEALATLLDHDVDDLRRLGRLDAPRLRALLMPDPVRDLLSWMDDPAATRSRLGEHWPTFASVCAGDYGLDPPKATAISAAGHLGRRQGAWAHVWERFAEAPGRYPNIPAVLDKARPGTLFGDEDPHPDSWPSHNVEKEDALRAALVAAAKADTRAAAAQRLVTLHAEHDDRLGSVWDQLGRAPLARAVAHLAAMSDAIAAATLPVGLAAIVGWYAETGHVVDDLALRAIAEARTAADREAVLSALGAVYDPWLDDVAVAFQSAAVPAYAGATGLAVEPGTCVVFVDALRMDFGARLRGVLADAGLTVTLTHRLAAFPTVTPTGQPAVAPLSTTLGAGPDFCAGDVSGRSASGQVLRDLLADAGVQFLRWNENGAPAGVGWTQTNAIDEYGHTHHHGLADAVDREIARIAERIAALLAAGWRRVVVVTDHGWLLPARPARKIELPLHLSEGGAARKPRVARLRPGHVVDLPTLPWTWDSEVKMVSPPGAAAFVAGTLYEHGGLSPQECVIPVITVTRTASPVEARIEALKWMGLRCRVDIAHPRPGLAVEIRTEPGDPTTRITHPKQVTDGESKVLVEDDALEGSVAYVVLIDDAGNVVAQRATRVGENE